MEIICGALFFLFTLLKTQLWFLSTPLPSFLNHSKWKSRYVFQLELGKFIFSLWVVRVHRLLRGKLGSTDHTQLARDKQKTHLKKRKEKKNQRCSELMESSLDGSRARMENHSLKCHWYSRVRLSPRALSFDDSQSPLRSPSIPKILEERLESSKQCSLYPLLMWFLFLIKKLIKDILFSHT